MIYTYLVYLSRFKIIQSFNINNKNIQNNKFYNFKIFVFNFENSLKKKIKLQLIIKNLKIFYNYKMFSIIIKIVNKIYKIWKEDGWLFLVILSLLSFFIYWLFFRKNKVKGTYSKSYFYEPDIKKSDMKFTYNMVKKPQGKDSKGELICEDI